MPDAGIAVNGSPKDQEREVLKCELMEKYGWYDKGSKSWSVAYNSSIFSAAGLSTISAVVLKVMSNNVLAQKISTLCASAAALLTTFIAGGGFARKWKANRLARGKIRQLFIDLEDPKADLSAIRTQLKKIMEEEDEAIVGPE